MLRVHLKGLKKCKVGTSQCLVTQSEKSCIHCRYIKCLNIGMRPDLLKGKRKEEREIESDSDQSPQREVSERENREEMSPREDSKPAVLADKVLQQTDLLLQSDPMYQTFKRFSDGEDLTDFQVDQLLKETMQEIEGKLGVLERMRFQAEKKENMPRNSVRKAIIVA